ALTADMRANTFTTIVGDIEFSALGEWKKERNLFVQFQNITDGDLEKYKKPGTKVILYPPELKSGTLHTPYGTPA
ncbi:MAG TPA: branched-chain amino acid ABC transporter substrate-binding protein, partial [Acetobacteraceae bacterium]